MARDLTATDTVLSGRRFALLQQCIACLGWSLLLGVGLMLASGQVVALSIGELVVHSSPGKSFRASAPLVLQGDEQLSELQVTLATAEYYAQRNLDHPVFLDGMHIGLLTTGKSNARIQFFGEQAWHGEEALLVLDVVWPTGQLSRRFQLAEVRRDEGGVEQVSQFVEVTENETLDAIAMRLSAGTNRSYLHMMYALYLANPEAFYGANMNNLKRGARLRVPTGAELYALKDDEVFRAIRRQYEQWRQQQETPAEATTQAGAMLAGMSDAQASVLDLDGEPHVLQQQLQELGEENESIQRRNAELKNRLTRLEQQMQQVTEQVLDYPTSTPTTPTEPAPVADSAPDRQEAPTVPAPVREKSGPAGAGGLPGYIMFIVLLLASGGGVLVWRYTAGRQGAGD